MRCFVKGTILAFCLILVVMVGACSNPASNSSTTSSSSSPPLTQSNADSLTATVMTAIASAATSALSSTLSAPAIKELAPGSITSIANQPRVIAALLGNSSPRSTINFTGIGVTGSITTTTSGETMTMTFSTYASTGVTIVSGTATYGLSVSGSSESLTYSGTLSILYSGVSYSYIFNIAATESSSGTVTYSGTYTINGYSYTYGGSSVTGTATVTIAAQSGTITSGTAGTASFAVTTSNIAAGSAGTIAWYTNSSATTKSSAPTGITASVSNVASNAAIVTMTATSSAVAGSYYFTVTEGSVVSLVGTLVISSLTSSSTAVVTTLAGSGSPGSANGTGSAASFLGPYGATVDSSGNIYVADSGNHLIRKITAAGVVTIFAGGGTPGSANGTGVAASFDFPGGVAIDSTGNVYVGDTSNQLIRKIISAGVVTTLAGSGTAGSTNGTGTAASFFSPEGVAVDSSGNVYVADMM